MELSIIEDSRQRPDLFLWFGAPAEDTLLQWLNQRQLKERLPSDLIGFWRRTGGGDVFDGETILGPFGDPELSDDVDGVNEFLRGQGLSARFLVFQTGLFTSAIDLNDGSYVVLSEQAFKEQSRSHTFEDWYRQTLRKEFSERYGL